MNLGNFLKEHRVRRGHDSLGSFANFLNAKGFKISREALRLFESGKIPKPETREMLCKALMFNDYEVREFKLLSALQYIKTKYDIDDLVLMDSLASVQMTNMIVSSVRTILYREVEDEQVVDRIIKEVQAVCSQVLKP